MPTTQPMRHQCLHSSTFPRSRAGTWVCVVSLGRTLGWGQLGDDGPHCPHVSQRQGGGGAFSSTEGGAEAGKPGFRPPHPCPDVPGDSGLGSCPSRYPGRSPLPHCMPFPGPLVKMRVGRPESESGARAGSKLEAPVISLFPPIGESAVAAPPESSQGARAPRAPPHPSQAAVLSASTETPPPVSGRGWPSWRVGAGTSWSACSDY